MFVTFSFLSINTNLVSTKQILIKPLSYLLLLLNFKHKLIIVSLNEKLRKLSKKQLIKLL